MLGKPVSPPSSRLGKARRVVNHTAPAAGWFGAWGHVAVMSTPGWTRTSDPGIRKFRRDSFESPEETTKLVVSRCPQTTSESTSEFASSASFLAQRAEKAPDLRIPRIHIGSANSPARACRQASSRRTPKTAEGPHRAPGDPLSAMRRCVAKSSRHASFMDDGQGIA